MNIIFNTKALTDKIKNIAPTAEAKQTLAILRNMKVDVTSDDATFTASDLEIEVSTTVKCTSDAAGSFTVPAKKMLEICNALSLVRGGGTEDFHSLAPSTCCRE